MERVFSIRLTGVYIYIIYICIELFWKLFVKPLFPSLLSALSMYLRGHHVKVTNRSHKIPSKNPEQRLIHFPFPDLWSPFYEFQKRSIVSIFCSFIVNAWQLDHFIFFQFRWRNPSSFASFELLHVAPFLWSFWSLFWFIKGNFFFRDYNSHHCIRISF